MNIDIWLHIQNIFESITSFEMKQRHYALLLFTALVIAIIKGRKYQPSGVRSDSDTSFDEDFQTYHPTTGLSMVGGVDAAGNHIGSSSRYEVFTDPRQIALDAGNHMHNGLFDEVTINPANGYQMMGGFDTAGNAYGTSSSSDYEHTSAHDPHHH